MSDTSPHMQMAPVQPVPFSYLPLPENGIFTVDDARRFLNEAEAWGMLVRIGMDCDEEVPRKELFELHAEVELMTMVCLCVLETGEPFKVVHDFNDEDSSLPSLRRAGIGEATMATWLPALVGVIIGAGVTLLTEQLRAGHEDRTRFHQQRLSAYARYVHMVTLLAAEWTRGSSPTSDEAEAFSVAAAEVSIIGSDSVRAAAQKVETTFSEASTHGVQGTGHFRDTIKKYREGFVAAVRAELL